MGKLNYEEKIKVYKEYKEGQSIQSLAKKYCVNYSNLRYMIKIIDLHGMDILRTDKNKVYPTWLKEELILKVLKGTNSIFNIAAEAGLISRTLLQEWLSKYKENGYNMVERKKGRTTMPKVTKNKNKETLEEENKRLKEENEYLKAELEYSKKLRAVVQARKNQQPKKK